MKAPNCIYFRDGLCHHGNLRDSAIKLSCPESYKVTFNKCKYLKKKPRKVKK